MSDKQISNSVSCLQEDDYLRQRLHPLPGDLHYLHLIDLRHALAAYASEETLRILDFGSGGAPYRSLFPNSNYLCADFAGTSNVDYTFGLDSKIAAEDCVFDLVLSTQVLEHVSCPRDYLVEARRLLKPGGRLLLTTHGLFEEHGCPQDYYRWTTAGLRNLLTDSGFNINQLNKLTCNARAALFISLRYPYLFCCNPRSSPHALLIWLLGKWFRCFREGIHRACDRLFADNAVGDEEDRSKIYYIALIAEATKV